MQPEYTDHVYWPLTRALSTLVPYERRPMELRVPPRNRALTSPYLSPGMSVCGMMGNLGDQKHLCVSDFGLVGYPIKSLTHTCGSVDSSHPSARPRPTHEDTGGKAKRGTGIQDPFLLCQP